MTTYKDEMFKSLVEWFKILNIKSPHLSAEDLSDGVALAQALNQFAPESFNDIWLSKIKSESVSNWRLKMSNLKKVIEGVYDYYSDVLNYSLSDFPKPDAMKIAEKCDMGELEHLLVLILGCAVNCSNKQNYIKQIMCLEESLQQIIMKALQELESTCQGNSLSRNSISIMNIDFKMLQEERDILAQKYFEAKKQIDLLIEEKSNFQQELARMQSDVEKRDMAPSAIGDDGISIGPVLTGSVRYSEMRRQLEKLKEELLQSDAAREDLKIKCQQQDKDLLMMKQRIDELTQCTAELSNLKDEIDVLRESNDKLKVCETQLNAYKKKLEDYNDLKKQVKMLEERSSDYIEQNAQYEEDAKKCATLKGQMELYKNEIQELHSKLDDEMSKNVKLEFENKNLESSLNALQRTKNSLLKERESLQEMIDEMKCSQLNASKKGNFGNTMSKELQPTVLIEKIQRLEMENKALREGQGGQTALVQLLDDANKRNENMREQLKYANEQILSLTHASENLDPNLKGHEFGKQLKQLMDTNEEKTLQLEETITNNTRLQAKLTQVENALASREQELIACDAKYRKCIESAKEVIKNLDPRIINATESSAPEKFRDVNEEQSKEAAMRKEEEQLMLTAFYRLGVNTQRDAIDSKLAILMGQGQTFLSRQRQSAAKRVLTSTQTK